MIYKVLWTKKSKKDFANIPSRDAARIIQKVELYLSKDPRKLGKSLTGKLSGLYRYRIGDYRVIYHIIEKEICISVVEVGHRKYIYN